MSILFALIGGLITWGITSAGAALVCFFRDSNGRAMRIMLGFSAGIMLAAAFWSLLQEAIEMSSSILPAAIGLTVGVIFLYCSDLLLARLRNTDEKLRRNILLMGAITVHNIPEGLAIGVAFGSAFAAGEPMLGAIMLTVGIGIQDFPEGTAVSVPLRSGGMSKTRAFVYGSLSGIVEPIGAVIGAALAITVTSLLPYTLAFAGGAMIYVVIQELIPETQGDKIATLGAMVGFLVMMILDNGMG